MFQNYHDTDSERSSAVGFTETSEPSSKVTFPERFLNHLSEPTSLSEPFNRIPIAL